MSPQRGKLVPWHLLDLPRAGVSTIPRGVISKSPFELGAADFRIFVNLVTLDRYLILCQGNKKGKTKDIKFILSPFYQRNILILMSYAVNHLL